MSQDPDTLPERTLLKGLGGTLVGIVLLSLIAGVLLWLRETELRPTLDFPEEKLPAPHRVSEIRQEPFAAVPPRPRDDKALESYGWVDRSHGIVRIPIERAMELTAQGVTP